MRYRFFLLVTMTAACAGLLAAAKASDFQGVEKVLRGAKFGATLEAFGAAHPQAVDESAGETAAAPPAKGNAEKASGEVSLTERFEKDPLLGLACIANYGFRDSALREFVVVWAGAQEAVAGQREAFLAACLQRHGLRFRRDIMQINPRKENPPLVPVLVWEYEDSVYTASIAWNADSEKAAGTFSYAMYAKDDPFLGIVLLASKLKPEVIQDAYAEVEPLLKKLAADANRQP